MKSFLQMVAEDLRRRIGSDFSRTIVIFPNKRACRFLSEHLLPAGDQPIWAPRYMAIDEFIRSLSPLQQADKIETVCRMYRIYARHTASREDLDSFYGWGERILADFDDLDKSMAPAKELFQSLKDYQAIGGDNELLTEEQIEQFKRFINGFDDSRQTEVKGRFLKLWNHLYDIYSDLRGELSSVGLAYDGQLYRDVAERITRGERLMDEAIDHVAFVGLNVVSEVERTIFRALQKQGKALFYWDYDTFYASAQTEDVAAAPDSVAKEAGVFLEQNLKDFPNALTDEAACFSNFLKRRSERTIHFIEAPTESAQAQSVTRWLSQPQYFRPEEARETAIVLCNEALLQPVLRALPEGVKDVNVTMGFPLSHTPAYALLVKEGERLLGEMDQMAVVEALKNLEQEGKLRLVEDTLKGFLTQLQETVAKEAGRQHEQAKERDANLDTLYTESYFQTYTLLTRFIRLVEEGLLTVRPFTLFKLVRQVLMAMTVPFHGEPVKGLQVMGVLETRCLDFKRVLMLSVGEGFLPQKATDTSFVPYLIRRHYGMTTSEHKTSVYAYYFHRLLQRAERATLEYNSSTEGLRKGEMSRFMNALLVEDADLPNEAKLHIKRFNLSSKPVQQPLAIHSAPKPADMAERVMKKVSPSKVNTYMRCPLQFYFKYVLNLPEKQEEVPIISAQDFGTVLHKAAELLYSEELTVDSAHPVTPQRLRHYLEDGKQAALLSLIRRACEAVNEERRKDTLHNEPEVEMNDISTKALVSYLKQLICFEAGQNEGQQVPAEWFVVNGTEEKKHIDLTVPYGKDLAQSTTVRLEGEIDRIDTALLPDGKRHLRIVDYKTGGKMEAVSELDALFRPGPKHPHYAMQTFLYALTMTGDPRCKDLNGEMLPIAPALFYLKQAMNKDFTPYITLAKQPMLDFNQIADKFKQGFIELLSDMLDPEKPFEGVNDNNTCRTCAFAELCGR